MHISEGVLSAPVLLAGGVVAVLGMGIGLAKVKNREIPKVAVMSAAFFVGSLVHVPIGPANIHLVLVGLVGILLGWSSIPAIVVALGLQAVLFGFGGLTTLGVNTCIMGIPAVTIGILFQKPIRSDNKTVAMVASFFAGATAIVFAAALLMMVLWTTGESFAAIAKVVFWAHLPLAVVEGLLTVFILGFIKKVRPEILGGEGAA